MGLFDLFNKIETDTLNLQGKINSEQNQTNEIANIKNPTLSIHEDLKDLIWFADGPLKNYNNENSERNTFHYNGYNITIQMTGQEEPSLIYTKQPIILPSDISKIERPPYFPTYSGLTPEQKGVYINLLQNPYNPNIDIGFVFILYYGLERHLLVGNYQKALNVIIKLRDVHSNKSFQSYSANALVLISMLKQKGEIALDFVNSIDKSFEYSFSDNLFLLCYLSFNLPISSKDIIRMAKTFEFSNVNYIKKYPELFEKVMENKIYDTYGQKKILLSNILNSEDLTKLPKQELPIFANTSIRDKSFPVPIISSSIKLKKILNEILTSTHEIVKEKIAAMRKEGLIDKSIKQKNEKDLPKFDEKRENELLDSLNKTNGNLLQRHFILISLQDFYYHYRDLDQKFLNYCIKYCLLDIESLTEMENQYINTEIERAKEYAEIMDIPFSTQEEKKIRETGFIGRIPAFNRLSIIYEKQKEYLKAIEICDKAIAFKHEADVYSERKEKLLKKIK
ncbi:TerB N-terminal domain-containing protein [Leptospira meyeri]|uniref:TerB N-terminal domain-containing protein n=1 Tax=Leptospira meyeri TaxID=29508 RepID=UPI0002BD8B0C|nr:TerB N-terminal domain-containing protein [Leptospira meyeri]EMJ86791.1 PF13208 domain protein [Leptospira meyeri serovar Semaranga str. Veldrot Semarang 173]